jgi:hypothetical protein
VQPGEILNLPGGATAIALELSQGDLRQRILWTLDSGGSGLFSYSRGYQGVWSVAGPGKVWNLNAVVLKKLVEEGLRLPGDDVVVSPGNRKLWQPDAAAAQDLLEQEAALTARQETLARIIPHRTFLRHSPDGSFFLARDGALYKYVPDPETGNAVSLVPGWEFWRQPALWFRDCLIDGSGQMNWYAASELHAYERPRQRIPYVSVSCSAPKDLEGVMMVGRTLAGDFCDVDGNLWSQTDDPGDGKGRAWQKTPLPPGCADVAWIPYEPGTRIVNRRNQVLLMEDGSVIALYVIRGRTKRIRLDGVSWKNPGEWISAAAENKNEKQEGDQP